MTVATRVQLKLALVAPNPARRTAVVTRAEKVETRKEQKDRCASCGKLSPDRALDVVRRDGVLVALCRSDRLSWDAPWRCAKGAAKRRRGRTMPAQRRQRARAQLEIGAR